MPSWLVPLQLVTHCDCWHIYCGPGEPAWVMNTFPTSPILEPEHDRGSRLVPGAAEADASERGGDPLGQQVPPPAAAPGKARQVRDRAGGQGGAGETFPSVSVGGAVHTAGT